MTLATSVVRLEAQHRQLPGEDITTLSVDEVAGWVSIYEELAGVLRSVIVRAGATRRADQLRFELASIEDRLAVWRDRHAELVGLVIDRKTHVVTFGGRSLHLTRREAELLDFMLRHPRRPFTAKQLATLAWQNSWLSDAQVRTYVMRLRRRLGEIGLDDLISVVRNRGYAVRS